MWYNNNNNKINTFKYKDIKGTYKSSACYSEDSHYQYRVWHSTTVSGRTCQAWAQQSPHSHSTRDNAFPDGSQAAAENYCRDPDGGSYLWCYTTDSETRWEPCDIPKCGQGMIYYVVKHIFCFKDYLNGL